MGLKQRVERALRVLRRVPDPWDLTVTRDPDGVPRFTVPAHSARLEDVGPSLNRQFALFYLHYAGTNSLVEADFRAAAFAYFDQVAGAGGSPDAYFNNFTIIGLPHPLRPLGFMAVWEWAIDILHAWEATSPGRWLHKGSGYYFAGMRDIALGDIDRGWLYIHAAANEDRRRAGTGRPATPSIWFATLDSSHASQAARDQVASFERLLIELLDNYRSRGRGSLTLFDYRDRFNRHPNLEGPLMTLAHALAHIARLANPATARIRNGPIAELVLSQASLEVCLVQEELLRSASGTSGMFGSLAAWYAGATGLTVTATDFGTLNGLFRGSFDTTMAEVLGGTTVSGFAKPLSQVERDLVAAYGIRNASAHGVTRPAAVTVEFDRLVPRLFFGVFRILEQLFP